MHCPHAICANGAICQNTSYGYNCDCGFRRFTTGSKCEKCVGLDLSQIDGVEIWTYIEFSFLLAFFLFGLCVVIYEWSWSWRCCCSNPDHRKTKKDYVQIIHMRPCLVRVFDSLSPWHVPLLTTPAGALLYIVSLRGPYAFAQSITLGKDRGKQICKFLFCTSGNAYCDGLSTGILFGLALLISGHLFACLSSYLNIAESGVKSTSQKTKHTKKEQQSFYEPYFPRIFHLEEAAAVVVVVLLFGIVLVTAMRVLRLQQHDRPCCYPFIAYHQADLAGIVLLMLLLAVLVVLHILCIVSLFGKNCFKIDHTNKLLAHDVWGMRTAADSGGLSFFMLAHAGCFVALIVLLGIDLGHMSDSAWNGTIRPNHKIASFLGTPKGELVILILCLFQLASTVVRVSVTCQARQKLESFEDSTEFSERSSLLMTEKRKESLPDMDESTIERLRNLREKLRWALFYYDAAKEASYFQQIKQSLKEILRIKSEFDTGLNLETTAMAIKQSVQSQQDLWQPYFLIRALLENEMNETLIAALRSIPPTSDKFQNLLKAAEQEAKLLKAKLNPKDTQALKRPVTRSRDA